MSRRPHRKPLAPFLESLEERQLLRAGGGMTVSMEARRRNLVIEARLERAERVEARLERIKLLDQLLVARRNRAHQALIDTRGTEAKPVLAAHKPAPTPRVALKDRNATSRTGKAAAKPVRKTTPTATSAGVTMLAAANSVSITASPATIQAATDPTAVNVFTISLSSATSSSVQVSFQVNTCSTTAQSSEYALSLSTQDASPPYSFSFNNSSGDGSVVIPAGQTEAIIAVAATNNSGSQTTSVNLNLELDSACSSGGSYTVGSPSNATLTIDENQSQPASVSVSSVGSITANDAPQTGFTVTRSGNDTSALTVNFFTDTGVTGVNNLPMANPADYSLSGSGVSFSENSGEGSGTVSFAPDQTTATIDVTASDASNLVYNPAELDLNFPDGPGYTVTGDPSPALDINADNTGPSIQIQPAAPITAIEGLGVGSSGDDLLATFQLANPNVASTWEDFTATIQWNDGSGATSPGTVQPNPNNSNGYEVLVPQPISFAYAEAGTYNPTVTVTDVQGGSASTNATVDVADAPLSATGVGTIYATVNVPFSDIVANFIDDNPKATSSDYTTPVIINWGDESQSDGTLTVSDAFGQTYTSVSVSGSHTYATAGNYPVSVTLDDKGGSTATATGTTADVTGSAPSVVGGGTYTTTVGQTFANTLASFSGGDPGDGYTAQITWGDGNSSAGTIAGDDVTGSHIYASAGMGYTVTVTVYNGSTSASATDTVNVVAPTPQVSSQVCPQPVTQDESGATSGNAGATEVSEGGTDSATGGVLDDDPTDLESDGFGTTWGQDLGWTNLSGTGSDSNNGDGMVNTYLPSLQQTTNGGIEAVNTAYDDVSFASNGSGGYTALFFVPATLKVNPANANQLVMTDASGDTFTFQGFGTGVPTAEQGQFVSFADPYGNIIQVTAYTASDSIAKVQRSGPATIGSSVTVTESYLYTYITSGVNAGLLSNVTLRRDYSNGVGSGVVQQVDYTYYDGTEPYGNPGDLELAQVEDSSNNVLDTTYYRYYTPTDVTTDHEAGYVGGLMYMLQTDSYARLAAAVSNPLTATDAQVAPFADTYDQYDTSGRVTETVTQASSCSCVGSTGQGIFTYAYTTSANPQGFNDWQTKTVETLPDGNQDIVYTNYAGEVILSAVYDISDAGNAALDGKVIATYYQYDSAGRLIMTAEPSAVTIQSLSALTTAATNNPDVVGYNAGNNTYQYLSSNSGVIDLTDFGATTTATATTPGDVAGYLKDDKVQNGYAGTPILLDSTQYISHQDANGNTVYETATSTVYRNTDGTGAETTTTAYTWYSGTNQIQSTTVSLPVISAAENGPGTADVTTVYYDTYGRPTWVKDPDGFISYTAYDNATGAVIETIDDVNTSNTSDFSNLPAGWATPAGGGLNLVTTYQVDDLGRTTKEVDPTGNVTYTVYNDPQHEVRVYPGWNATTGTTTGPIEVYRQDLAGSYDETLTMAVTPAVSGTPGSYVPIGAEDISDIQSLTRTLYDDSDRPIEEDDYVSLAGTSYSTTTFYLGTAGINYDATLYGYDDLGRMDHVVDPNGTITDTYYDTLGDPISTYVGTTSSTTPTEEWSSDHTGMTLVSQNQYDDNGVGDGDLTQTTDYPDSNASDAQVTQYAYDWRDRLVATKSGVQSNESTAIGRPILYYTLDNLGEITAVSQYDGDGVALTNTMPSASLLRAYTTTSYDDQGRPYQVQQYNVNQTTGALGGALTTAYYYDHRGDLVAESDPGGLWTKDQYDGDDRLVDDAETDGAGGSSWSAATTIAGDHVLTQTLTAYDGDGNPILITTKDRFDTDSSAPTMDLGPLGNPTTGPQARVSYTANYYDQDDRLTASVDIGTNGGNAYTRPASPPARSATALVTSYAYGPDGLVQTTTDPLGVVTATAYDMLGQVTQTIDAYEPTVNNGLPTNSANQTTDYTYDGNGDVTTVTAVMPAGTPSQTTAYVYGVTTNSGSALGDNSEINSNDLLAAIEYPDPTTGLASTDSANQETYSYDALGDTRTDTDPNGTTHTYGYDVLDRQVSDTVTTLGAGVDGSVMALTTAYDSAGNPYLFTSLNATGGIVNQVEDVYNGFGQLVAEYQEQDGAVNTATTPEVQYTYNDPADGQNNSRPTSMVYPNGRVLNDVYDSGTSGSSGLDSAISRISALQDGTGTTDSGQTLEAYTYLGLDTIVERDYAQPGIALSYDDPSATNPNTSGGDKYTGLNQFGEVVDQNWINTSTGASVVRQQYAYDDDGDLLYDDNLVDTALSQLYQANGAAPANAYDPLGRITSFEQGTLSASGNNGTQLDTVAAPTTSQSWQLDALGNWLAVTSSGTTTTNGTTNRLFNAQDQTTNATGLPEPGYDLDGNTTSDNGQLDVYDAWGRLVKVEDGTNGDAPQATYSYDALGRRTTEYNAAAGTTTHLYYDSAGQVIEERLNGTAASNVSQQYVWSLSYVNALVLRDSFSGGSLTERLYALQDANYDTVALVNTSGSVVEQYVYTPYGTVTVLNASGNPVSGNQSAYGWQYLYQGGRLDAVTGWYEFGARDYIPAEGRWAERDPLGLGGGDPDIYGFVFDSPADSLDPSGLGPWYWANYGPNQTASPFWNGTGGFVNSVLGNTVGWVIPFGDLGATGSRLNNNVNDHSSYAASTYGGRTPQELLQPFDQPNLSAGRGFSAKGNFVNPELSQSGMAAAQTFGAATTPIRPCLTPASGPPSLTAQTATQSNVRAPFARSISSPSRVRAAFCNGKLPNPAFKFTGARRIDSLRNATHADIVNAFAGTGLTPTGHFVMRIKDSRLSGIGFNTFGDLEGVLRYGVPVFQDGGTVALVYGKLAVVIDPVRNLLITIQPK